MVALFVILTFVIAVLIDHLLSRSPITVVSDAIEPAPAPRPRLVPSIVAGFSLPENLSYHPGHTWAVAETPELVRVGADDFAVKLAGGISSIDIPTRGQWVRQGQKIVSMHHQGREIALVSPIEGTVVDVNDAALDNPSLAQSDPYGDGWLLKVNSPDAKTNFRNLLSGNVARKWLDDAAAKLRAYMAPTPALATVMAQDGGLAVTNVIDQLPDADWDKLQKDFFLA
ncbi:MAG: glycine cleavage system protein H [Thermoanaerobaculia bacterium]